MRAVLPIMLALVGCGRIGFERDGSASRSVLATDRVDLGQSLADFPLLVVLDDTRADRASMAPDASDLRFSLPDGTALSAEIVQVGAVGGLPTLAYVRVPRLDSTTRINVDYGHAPVLPPPIAVWSSDYVALWHLDDATSARDATTDMHDGTLFGTQSIPGVVGAARSFTPGDFIRVDDASSLDLPTFTISGWHLLRVAQPYSVMVTRQLDDTDKSDFLLSTFSGAAIAQVSAGAQTDVGDSGPDVPLGVWVHLAATFDGSNVRLYVDGSLVKTTPLSGSAHHSPRPIFLGAECSSACNATANDDFLDGAIDEIRIERVVRPDTRIRGDVLSMRDGLISYGPVGP